MDFYGMISLSSRNKYKCDARRVHKLGSLAFGEVIHICCHTAQYMYKLKVSWG